jgi:two-component system sensor histidine kinase/response regulator
MSEPIVKILIVDDLRENLIALEALLLSWPAGTASPSGRDGSNGLELLSARSGREALELLLVHDVALALIDLHMPEMDGLELAELMRGSQRTRHVPIIFVTAGTRDQQRMFRGYEVGAVDFLYKPIEPVLLGHKVATFVDLHRQRLERERLADELREMLRLNEMFVAAVSHDLRSPLSTLLMGASVLHGKLADPTLDRTLARMRSSAERMRGMLDELYDLARVRLAGGIAIEPGPTDFGRLAQRVADEIGVAHPGRRLIVEAEGGSSDGQWDEARLAQVLANLIGNALRHGDAEQPVRVRWRGAADALVLEVHNGGAIPSSVREHLFDPFRRGTRARDSLGLGLYIVRQIVLAHGGAIDVASTESEGTTFRVRLPRRAAVGVANEAPSVQVESQIESEVESEAPSVQVESQIESAVESEAPGPIGDAASGATPPAE